jgi:hypothetical protein
MPALWLSTAKILVTLGGIAAVAWVNWYFFLAEKARPQSTSNEPEAHQHH